MTETNNLIILGLDHGYGNIKTANTIFPANVQRCTAEPAMAETKLCWAGHWFIVGEGPCSGSRGEALWSESRGETFGPVKC